MKSVITFAAILVLFGSARAQYEEVWESEIYDPMRTYLIGIAQMDSDPGSEMVVLDYEFRTDQWPLLRILDATTGEDEWESDEFYMITTQAPNQPRRVDVDQDGRTELLLMAGYDPYEWVWTLLKFRPNAGGKLAVHRARADRARASRPKRVARPAPLDARK